MRASPHLRRQRRPLEVLLLLLLATALPLAAQEVPPLFASEDVLELTLQADFKALRGDRRGETPERPGVVLLRTAEGDRPLQVQLRTRGRFRRESANCSMPPLRINFKKKEVEGTVFAGQDKMKIVGSCRPNRDSFEQLVLKEYLVYRMLQLITPASFRVRLARITYEDTSGENDAYTRFAFFIEDDDDLASRLGARVFALPEGGNLPPTALDVPTAATVAVFQYMIGNTDWSDVAGHNVELLDVGGIAVGVPYDFDFSGFVDAPYATPDPSLHLDDVRERLYRGWCWPGATPASILPPFREARAAILRMVSTFPHLDPGSRNDAQRYLEPFFDGIETNDKAHRRMFRDCRALPGSR